MIGSNDYDHRLKQQLKELQNVKLQVSKLNNLVNALSKENRHLKNKINQLTHDISVISRKV